MDHYLRDAWYMAGWAEELDGQGFSREILGRRIFLFRDADGGAVAMLDRCPHRFAPLSLGTRDGDMIVCGYHGLGFATDGRCVRNPFDARIPAGAVVETFAAAERDAIVWLWGGDKAAADPALIPDFGFVSVQPIRARHHADAGEL